MFVAALLLTLASCLCQITGQTVKARKLSLMVDTATTWNTANRVCKSVGMTLPTVDKHLTEFLRSQSFSPVFQQKVKEDFWIGLHDSDLANPSSALSGYQWVGTCNALADWAAWGRDQPSDTDEAYCVYTTNDTFLWSTDKCDKTHHFMCEQSKTSCLYNQTDTRCELFTAATSKLILLSTDQHVCAAHCEATVKDSNPCWGFTLERTGCTLYYQPAQPNCTITSSSAGFVFFRSCFLLYYIHGPIFLGTSNDKVPVSHCEPPPTTEGTTAANKSDATTQPMSASQSTNSNLTTAATTTKATTTETTPMPSMTQTSAEFQHSTGNMFATVSDENTSAGDICEQTTTTDNYENEITIIPDLFSVQTAETLKERAETMDETTEVISETSPATEETTAASRLVLQKTAVRRPIPKLPVLAKCVCTLDVKTTPENMTSALRAVEETKKFLSVDKHILSKTRRKHGSAEDPRITSQGMAYFGMAFIGLTLSCIVLPDLITLMCHLRYGAGYYGYAVAKGRQRMTSTKAACRKYSTGTA